MPNSTSRTFKILVFPKENKGFWIIRLSKLASIFDAIWMPTCLHFAFQNPPKSFRNLIPRGIQKLIDFGFDFWSIWAPCWEPSWSHVAHQDAPKTPPRRPKTPPRRPTKLSRRPQDTKTPSRGPKTPPRWDLGRFFMDFWWMFNSFWVDFSCSFWL